MGYSNFLFLKEELSLIAVMLRLVRLSEKPEIFSSGSLCIVSGPYTAESFSCRDGRGFRRDVCVHPHRFDRKNYPEHRYAYCPAPGLQLGKQRVGTDPPGRILPDSVLLLAGYVFHDFCGQFSVILHRPGDSLYSDGRVVCIRQIQTPVGRSRG